MHPSVLEDADGLPVRRLRENFGKCLKKKPLEIEPDTMALEEEGRRVQPNGWDANTPTGCLLYGARTKRGRGEEPMWTGVVKPLRAQHNPKICSHG
jgi:hypothetical protein